MFTILYIQASLIFIFFLLLIENANTGNPLLNLKIVSVLTLILLEPKVINHCHQYRARPAVWPGSILLDPLINNGQCQKNGGLFHL